MSGKEISKKDLTVLNKALRHVQPALTSLIVFSMVINLLGLAGPLYMMQVYDRVLASRSVPTLVWLTLIIAFVYAIAAILESLRTRLLVRAGAKFDQVVSDGVFDSVQAATIRAPASTHTQALRDIDTVREFFSGAALMSLCDLPWAPIYIAVAFMLHPAYGIVAVLTTIASGGLAYANSRLTKPVLDEASRAAIAAHNHAASTFRNAEVLHALGMVPSLRNRWVERHSAALNAQAQASDRAGIIVAATKFQRTFIQSGILGLGAYLAINREITPGTIIAASIIVGRCIQPIELAIGHWKAMVSVRGAFERLQALLRAFPRPSERLRLPEPRGELTVEGLYTQAPGRDVVILKGISFQLPAGATLGIVGPSAAGKSSLARSLVGVWPATAGAVRLDGSNLDHWDPQQLGAGLGYLPQDVELFSGTIAENISRFGAVDDQKIIHAAKLAGVHELIQQLPDGYNTQIGEGGHALSGGQRQRIGLARAIYGLPAVIVLDEPNASLDTAGELALTKAIQALHQQKRTLVIVTHRTNILSLCDMILVLQDGTVQAYGPRDVILARILGPRVVAAPVAPAPASVTPTPAGADARSGEAAAPDEAGRLRAGVALHSAQ